MHIFHLKVLKYVILAAIFFTLSYSVKNFEQKRSGTVISQKVIINSINEIAEDLENKNISLFKKLINTNNIELLNNDNQIIAELKDEFHLFIFKKDSLIFWSDNAVPDISPQLFQKNKTQLLKLENGYYICNFLVENTYQSALLFKLKSEYKYSNKFISNGYSNKIPLSINWNIVEYGQGDYNLTFNNQDLNFGLTKRNTDSEESKSLPLFSSILFILGFLFFLLFFSDLNIFQKTEKQILIWQFFLAILFASIFIILKKTHLLNQLFQGTFSKSEYFSGGILVSSLIELLFLSLIFLVYSYNFYLHPPKIKWNNSVVLFVFKLLIISIIFSLISLLINDLVLNSTICFNISDIFELSVFTLLSFLSISQLILGVILLIICEFKTKQFSPIEKVLTAAIPGLILFLFLNLFGDFHYSAYLFLIILIFFSNGIINFRKTDIYTQRVIYLILASLFVLIQIGNANKTREINKKKILALKVSSERDEIAELLFSEIEKDIESDSILLSMIDNTNADEILIEEYISKKYFNGFWKKYDTRVFICKPNDTIIVEPENIAYGCNDFFIELIEENSVKVYNCNFYFLENRSSYTSYLGKIKFSSRFSGNIYIELSGKLVGQELGYPELLLSKGEGKANSLLNSYSYATYIDDKLVKQSGDYSYALSAVSFPNSNSEYLEYNQNSYDHLLYRPRENHLTIISKNSITIFDNLISFSYIFVFLHLLLTLILLIKNLNKKSFYAPINFKNKIRFTMIVILVFSTFLIGGTTLFSNIKQFETLQYQTLKEKIQSVLVELEHKLADKESLQQSDFDYLSYYLVKFSNVFYTDINVYNLEGKLFATSRPEIFDRNLQSKLMNPYAFRKLSIEHKAEFTHQENIGELRYLSSYVPFRNSNNELLAYLNLPYFTKQNILKNEVASLVSTVVNIYVFLILLSMIVLFFVSNIITKPLQLIQKRIEQTSFDKRNEPISYNRKDEIGELVSEYNRMLAELEKSANLLAKSERESAWREMARQVAHEIKNPLTPMKLHMQFLEKAWNDNVPDFSNRISETSKTMIEQIDKLSNIASAFSNFAQMPQVILTKINLVEILEEIQTLFKNSENVEISLNYFKNNIFVNADKEQLFRVFTNLVKNAIQAIPKSRKGIVSIAITEENGNTRIEIADNGIGIKDDQKDKLFEPNFTTKSSGTGLGLAISRNIIENLKGELDFETIIDEGTKFYVIIPLLK